MRCTHLLCLAAVASVLASSARAAADPPTVRARKESALPPGVLPAWETDAEKASQPPMVRNLPPVLPTPPPPTGYRVPAEFEPVAAFVVSQGDWQDTFWSSEVDMLV
ncbi:MAG: hypothetical protein ACOC1F_11575, partial [Myxococcota bacterium]